MSQSGDNKTNGQIVTLPVSSSRFWRAPQSDAAQSGTDSGSILNDKTPAGAPAGVCKSIGGAFL
jgi:hypothetical protein